MSVLEPCQHKTTKEAPLAHLASLPSSVTLALFWAQAAAPVPFPENSVVAVAVSSPVVFEEVLVSTTPTAPALVAALAAERISATPGVVLRAVVAVLVRVIAVVAFGAGAVANVPHHAARVWGNQTKKITIQAATQRKNDTIDAKVFLYARGPQVGPRGIARRHTLRALPPSSGRSCAVVVGVAEVSFPTARDAASDDYRDDNEFDKRATAATTATATQR